MTEQTTETALSSDPTEVRRQKLALLREQVGDVYPAHFHRTMTNAEFAEKYAGLELDETSDDIITVAGRVYSSRNSGMFMDIHDASGKIQIFSHKDTTPEDVAQTILDMKAGASPISPMIARRVLAKYRALQVPAAPVASVPDSGWGDLHPVAPMEEKVQLSNREQEVLELIARGFSYAEIARLKAVSVHTVQTHIKNLYQKLAVHSRSEAVFEASRMGLGRLGAGGNAAYISRCRRARVGKFRGQRCQPRSTASLEPWAYSAKRTPL